MRYVVLSPEELNKYARQFRTEADILMFRDQIVHWLMDGLKRLMEREQESERTSVLRALAEDVIRNLQQYRVGLDLTHLAWTTRNIFELETILAFVTASPENLQAFIDDVILDEIQVREASIMLEFDRPTPEVAEKQKEALERFRQHKEHRNIVRNRPMQTSEMARRLSPERKARYDAFNKLYSKLVHPTALSLIHI